MSQIFEFCQVSQFDENRVDSQPAVNRCRYNYDPQNGHKNIVEEVQVVYYGKEEECYESKCDEYSIAPQPGKDLVLILLK